MEQIKPTLIKALWFSVIDLDVYRMVTSTNLGLSAVEGLMILIAAFVAHKTLDLIIQNKD